MCRHRFIHPHLPLMANDVLLSLEGLFAGVARKKPLVAVDVLLVDLEVAAVGEGLLAGFTAIDDFRFHPVVRAGRQSDIGLDVSAQLAFMFYT